MPPRKRAAKKTGPTPVESLRHDEKRTNIPTEELRDFVAEDEAKAPTVLYPRDPSLDPQLVWRGKDEQDAPGAFEVPAVPLYIQEKVDPRVIIENLRDTAKAGEPEPELTLFDDFDGVEAGLDQVEFYEHDANWSNRMILGDSLLVMTSLAEKERLRGKVQMIYVDPPYGIKFGSNWQVSTRKRDVKDGKDVTRQPEQVKAFRDTWQLGIHSYLSYLRDRLVAARELLTESGSIFVQIGDENVHLVRSLLDEVFGAENFVSQISVRTTSTMAAELLGNVADYILWYGRDRGQVKYRQLYQAKEPGSSAATLYRRVRLLDGSERPATADELADPAHLPPGARLFRPDNLTNQRPVGAGDVKSFVYEGKTYTPGKGKFKTDQSGLQALAKANRLYPTRGGTLQYVRFLDDFPAYPYNNVWTDTGTGSFTDSKTYVVQTNVKVIQRCVSMTTDPGDLVLDPTCGSGTTAYVAEQWGRRWITIDTSRVALALARTRIMAARYPWYMLADSEEGARKEEDLSGIPQAGNGFQGDVRQGFVYKRVPHITLKSIARNVNIKEGMTREEIDAVIARDAEQELLVDQPYEDKSKVRVAGPFTVESLSPHRNLDVVDEPVAGSAGFLPTILENLRAAGVQNTFKGERLSFDSLEPLPDGLLHAHGTFTDAEGEQRTVAVFIGPEHGTVSPEMVKEAARAAVKGVGFDLLVVCGFAFEAYATEAAKEFEPESGGFVAAAKERKLGRLRVLLTRMNPDLVMSEELLKKTGAGNLFMVFGEPDVTIERTDDGKVVVELRGVDVYDPTTGEVRESTTDDIACWFIDTDYNGESFFVRHAYFTGGNDPYEKLKRALKADIDPDAWATLYSARSRPFDPPSTGQIAIKVINHYGDEVLQVFPVVSGHRA